MSVLLLKTYAQEYVYRATDDNICDEPELTGGTLCKENNECNSGAKSKFGKNKCDLTKKINTTTRTSVGIKSIIVGKCMCAQDYTKIDCSYKRYDKDLAGGLQFLCFIGIGGIGNFVADRTTQGILQLLMMMSLLIICCVLCCGALCVALSESDTYNCDCTTSNECFACIGWVILCLICLVMVGGFIWCIVDAGLFFSGELKDDSGFYPYGADCIFKQG